MKLKFRTGILLVLFTLGFLLSGSASAQEATAVAESTSSVSSILDNLWIVIAGILVFFMQAGFALVEAGMTRSKNVANIMAKNLADVTIGVLVFFFVGYMFAFGSGGNSFIGWGDSLLGMSQGALSDISDGLSPATTFFFQAVFAATAVTIVSGALAGRAKFSTYLIFGAFMTAVIYPLVVHWTWGGGFISELRVGDAAYSDFAGSTVVHSVGGWAALMGAIIIGPRIGKFGPDGKAKAMAGHSTPFVVLGVFILWFGWFGFNAGSQLAADNLISFLAMNTMLAGVAGVVGSTLVNWSLKSKPDVNTSANGALAGLVSVTAGVGTVSSLGAVIIGFVGGLLVVGSVHLIDRLKIDDPVGAISVHGVCGIWGTLAVGLFAVNADAFVEAGVAEGESYTPSGLFYGGGVNQLIVQAIFVAIVAAWVLLTSGILFFVLKNTIGLRVSRQDEESGLDITEHGSGGYSLSVPEWSVQSYGIPGSQEQEVVVLPDIGAEKVAQK